MALPDYDSPRALKAFLEERGFAMQKKFGQNFLVSPSARAKIAALVGARPGDRVWEIGPGLGSLSSAILDSGAGLAAFEIDRGFIAALRDFFGDRPGFRIVEGDFLKTWKAELAASGAPDLVCGNLPYNAAGAFMADFAESLFRPRRMVFTVQKEGADRMRAKPGNANYSSFSVLCQSVYAIKAETDLGPGCFWPAPEVTSTVVSILPREDFPALADRALFLRLTRTLFQSRRKTIQNNLKASGIPDFGPALEEAGIASKARAETLSPEKIAELANILSRRDEGPEKSVH